MTGGKVFIDTNILVYAYDDTSGDKYTRALGVIEELWMSGMGVISTQVLQEFYVSVTRKISNPVGLAKAKEIVEDYLKWSTVIINGRIILSAIDVQREYKYSFWDSLIIASALDGGALILLTEDLTHGHIVKDLEIKNPLL